MLLTCTLCHNAAPGCSTRSITTLPNSSPTIQNRNGFSVANSQEFSNEIADVNIQDHETMVSFDVVSLFTAIPVDKACDYIRKKLGDDSSLHSRTKP